MMLELIKQLKANQPKRFSLFFDENRIGEEVKNNLVSISAAGVVISDKERKELINILSEIIDQIKMDLKTLYQSKCMKFYLWFDQGEELLRWTVISDIDQAGLPFSSEVEEVTITKVVENWLAPRSIASDELSFSEIEGMTSSELRTLMSSLEVPTLDVFIHCFS